MIEKIKCKKNVENMTEANQMIRPESNGGGGEVVEGAECPVFFPPATGLMHKASGDKAT